MTLDPARCGIKSIIDKQTGRELVNAQSPYALGQYLYERFDADQGLRHALAYVAPPPKDAGGDRRPEQAPYALGEGASLLRGDGAGRDGGDLYRRDIGHGRAQGGPARHHSRRDATPRQALRRRALAGPGVVDCPEDARSLARGRLALLPAPRRRSEVPPRSIGQHRRSGQRPGPQPNHDIFCLNGGLTVEGGDGGRTGICPIDAQLVSLERPGLWHYSRDFVAHKPDVFVMLFNNLYSTNFAQWIEGSWLSRVRLWPIERRESTASSLIGASWEARLPCLAAVSDAPPGKLPPQATGLAVEKQASTATPSAAAPSSRGPLVTAFGPNPYGEGTLLRFWDQAGDGGVFAVHLPRAERSPCAAGDLPRPADRRGDHGLRRGRVQRDDSSDGPGKLSSFWRRCETRRRTANSDTSASPNAAVSPDRANHVANAPR